MGTVKATGPTGPTDVTARAAAGGGGLATAAAPTPEARRTEGNSGPRTVRQRPARAANAGPEATDTLLHLHRAANAVRHHVEQAVLRPQGLTWTGFLVLRAVWAEPRIETRHAADEAGISKATLTGVVDTLVGRGLMRRTGHPGDGRLVLLELTRKGQRLVRELLPASRDEEEFALSCLPAEQLTEATVALRRICEHLSEAAARDRR